MKNKKVAFVGAEEHTRNNAPWDDESFDIWLVNEWAMESWVKRYTASIDIHWDFIYPDPQYDRGNGYWEWLQKPRGKPVYMQKKDPSVPDSVEYPLKAINKKFLSTLTYEGRPVRNFRTSVSYAIALALYQNYEQIDIYGVELTGIEYKGQKSNFSFWIGVATGLGVKVDLHCSQDSFVAPLYGYEAFMKDTRIMDYMNGLKQQIKEEEKKMNMLEGAYQLTVQMLENEQKNDTNTPE